MPTDADEQCAYLIASVPHADHSLTCHYSYCTASVIIRSVTLIMTPAVSGVSEILANKTES